MISISSTFQIQLIFFSSSNILYLINNCTDTQNKELIWGVKENTGLEQIRGTEPVEKLKKNVQLIQMVCKIYE